jgi:hypothetical protein
MPGWHWLVDHKTASILGGCHSPRAPALLRNRTGPSQLRSGAIEYRRTVFQYFDWLLGHNRLASVNRYASTAIRMCAKGGSALKTPFRRKAYWSMHQISCSKEYCSRYDSNLYSLAADLTLCHPLTGILSYFLKHGYMLKEGGLPSGL